MLAPEFKPSPCNVKKEEVFGEPSNQTNEPQFCSALPASPALHNLQNKYPSIKFCSYSGLTLEMEYTLMSSSCVAHSPSEGSLIMSSMTIIQQRKGSKGVFRTKSKGAWVLTSILMDKLTLRLLIVTHNFQSTITEPLSHELGYRLHEVDLLTTLGSWSKYPCSLSLRS